MSLRNLPVIKEEKKVWYVTKDKKKKRHKHVMERGTQLFCILKALRGFDIIDSKENEIPMVGF